MISDNNRSDGGRDHFKNAVHPKNRTSRENILKSDRERT
jgi:hypothetical protein